MATWQNPKRIIIILLPDAPDDKAPLGKYYYNTHAVFSINIISISLYLVLSIEAGESNIEIIIANFINNVCVSGCCVRYRAYGLPTGGIIIFSSSSKCHEADAARPLGVRDPRGLFYHEIYEK